MPPRLRTISVRQKVLGWQKTPTGMVASAEARIGRAVGDQIGTEQRRHIAAGRVMLTQEARQGSGRHGFQQTPRTLVAGVAGARKNLGRALAGFEIRRLRQHRVRCETADQKRHRR